MSRPLTAFKYSSNLARSWPPSALPNSVHHGPRVHLQPARSRPPSESPDSPDPALAVNLQTHLITASECISWLGRLQPTSSPDRGLQAHLQTTSITASKRMSPKLHDCGIQVRTIMAWKCISKVARLRPASADLQTCLITASKCTSKLTPSWRPIVSPDSHHYGL